MTKSSPINTNRISSADDCRSSTSPQPSPSSPSSSSSSSSSDSPTINQSPALNRPSPSPTLQAATTSTALPPRSPPQQNILNQSNLNPRNTGNRFLAAPSEFNRSPPSKHSNNSNFRHISPSILLQSNITQNYPRSITPSRFLSSSSSSSSTSSPIPSHSVYALVSSTARSLGTPTSDIRATSVSLPSPELSPSRLHRQQQSIKSDQTESTVPDNSTNAAHLSLPLLDEAPSQQKPSSSPASQDTLRLASDPQNRVSSIDSEKVNPQSLKPIRNALDHSNDFWVILDHSLKVVFLDPTFRIRLDASEIGSIESIYELVRPEHVDLIRTQVELANLGAHQANQSCQSIPKTKDPFLAKDLPQVELFDIFPDHGSEHPSSGPASRQLSLIQWLNGDRSPLKISCEVVSSSLSSSFLFSEQSSSVKTSYSSSCLSPGQHFVSAEIFLHTIDSDLVLGLIHYCGSPDSEDSVAAIPLSPHDKSNSSHNASEASAIHNTLGPHLLDPQQIRLLDLALSPSRSTSASIHPQLLESPANSPGSQTHFQPISQPPDIFVILDTSTGQTLFNYPPVNTALTPLPSSPLHLHPPPARPHNSPPSQKYQSHCVQDFTRCILEAKSQAFLGASTESEPQIKTETRQVISDCVVLNVDFSFSVQCGNLIFAALRCTLPPYHRSPQRSPSVSSIVSQIPSRTHHGPRPAPLQLIHDHPSSIPLDIYSPSSAGNARGAKRPRTDSASEIVLTPQTASSSHSSQAFAHNPYRRPSVNSSNAYSPYLPHHSHHHSPPLFLSAAHTRLHHPHQASQLSPLVSNIPVPESPESYGAQFTNFTGELSPTMASAANVLGSFHRAHYHHPQAIMALQDVARSHQLSTSTAHQPMIGYDNYGLQSLAAMAVAGSFEHPPEFSPLSSSSSHHTSAPDAFSSSASCSAPMSSTYRSSQSIPSKQQTHHSPASVDPGQESSIGVRMSSNLPELVDCSNRAGKYNSIVDDGTRTAKPNASRGVGFNKRGRMPTTDSTQQGSIRLESTASSTGAASTPGNAGGISGGAVATIRCCTSCGVQNSPEWRKGPNGVKSLCNACGLRFSRAQARKTKQPKSNLNQGANFIGVQNKSSPGGTKGKKKIIMVGIGPNGSTAPMSAKGIARIVKPNHQNLSTTAMINPSNDGNISVGSYQP